MYYKIVLSIAILSGGVLYGMEQSIEQKDLSKHVFKATKKDLKKVGANEQAVESDGKLFNQGKLSIAVSKDLTKVFGTYGDIFAVYNSKTGEVEDEYNIGYYTPDKSAKGLVKGCAVDDQAQKCIFNCVTQEAIPSDSYTNIGFYTQGEAMQFVSDGTILGSPAISHNGKQGAWWWCLEAEKKWALRIFTLETWCAISSPDQEGMSKQQQFSPNDELIAFCLELTEGLVIKILEVKDGKDFQKIKVTDSAFAFSPDSKRLIGIDKGLKVWNVQDGQEVCVLDNEDTPEKVVAWLNDNQVAALYKDKLSNYWIKVYDLVKKDWVKSIELPTEASPKNTQFYSAQLLAKDNELMFVASNDNGTTVKKWPIVDQVSSNGYCTIQ